MGSIGVHGFVLPRGLGKIFKKGSQDMEKMFKNGFPAVPVFVRSLGQVEIVKTGPPLDLV